MVTAYSTVFRMFFKIIMHEESMFFTLSRTLFSVVFVNAKGTHVFVHVIMII